MGKKIRHIPVRVNFWRRPLLWNQEWWVIKSWQLFIFEEIMNVSDQDLIKFRESSTSYEIVFDINQELMRRAGLKGYLGC